MGSISPRLQEWLDAYERSASDGEARALAGFGNDGTVAVAVTVESGYVAEVASVMRLAGARHVKELPRKSRVEADATPRSIRAAAKHHAVETVDSARAVMIF